MNTAGEFAARGDAMQALEAALSDLRPHEDESVIPASSELGLEKRVAESAE